jgi:hypothetical protein
MKADPENRPYRDHTTSSLIDLYRGMVAQLDGIDSYDMDDIQAWQRLAAISDCAIDYANEIMHRFDDHGKNTLDEAVAKRKAKEQQQCES